MTTEVSDGDEATTCGVVLNDDGDVCMATLHASEARVAAAADARADGHSQRHLHRRAPTGDVVLSRETHKKIEADLVNAHDAWVRGMTSR